MHSEQINELMMALAKAQGQMSGAIKANDNPYFKSKYADLSEVWDACREPLSNNGLAVTQIVSEENEKQALVTILGHSSGQWIKSVMALPIQKPGPQEIGSCITYCRRYALAAIVGVYQDDDDGESAQKSFREGTGIIGEKELHNMKDLIKKLDNPNAESFMCNKANIKSLDKFPKYKYEDAIKYLEKQIETKNKNKEVKDEQPSSRVA